MKQPVPEFAPPLCVYLAFLFAALAIGNERSCNGGWGFYVILGLAGIPVLLVSPFFLSKARGPIIQFIMSVFYLLLGVLAWVGAFLLSDMRFVCSLF